MKLFFPLLPLGLLCAQAPVPAPKPAAVKPAVVKPKPAAAAPKTASADPVVITVGTQKITQSQYEKLIEALPERTRAEASGPNRRRFAEQIAEIRAMVTEAEARKIDQQEQVKLQLGLQRDTFLASTMYQQMLANLKVTDAQVQAYYDQHKNEWEQVTAKHILVRFQGSRVPVREGQKDLTEAEALARAQELRKKLTEGAKFDEVAKADSDDTGTGARGGELGTFGRGQMVPAFETAAFAAKPGELSEPVKSPFGYHLILVTDHKTKDLAAARPDIEKQLKPQMAQQAVEEIRKKAGIVLDETYFGK
ncbi:MAG: peptidylprolyl isomerase [Bryobacteraceae bacterium]|nr:peptidylprolyl isomerase [Bryobacteraceae bacterium]